MRRDLLSLAIVSVLLGSSGSSIAQDTLCVRGVDSRAMFRQGTYFEHSGPKSIALRCYDLARQQMPTEYRYHRAYIRVAHQMGFPREFFKEFEQPQSDPRLEVIRLILLSRLHEYEPDEFVGFALKAVQGDPENVWAANALGAAYDVAGKVDTAVQILEDAYVRFDKHPETALILANVLRSKGLPTERMLKLLGEAEKDEYYRPYARAFGGLYLIEMGDVSKGLGILTENSERYPYFGLSYFFLAHHYITAEHDLPKAVKSYVAAIQRNLGDAIFLNNAAWEILLSSKTERDIVLGTQFAERAVDISGRNSALILDTLAEGRFRLGQIDDAIDLLNEAVRIATIDKNYYVERLTKIRASKSGR